MTGTLPFGSTEEVSWREEEEGVSVRVQERIVVRGPSREFEPLEQTIQNWVKQADLDEGLRSDGPTTEARKEMRRLKREVKRLGMERDVLKAIMAVPPGLATPMLKQAQPVRKGGWQG